MLILRYQTVKKYQIGNGIYNSKIKESSLGCKNTFMVDINNRLIKIG